MGESIDKDALSRERIVSDIHTNLFVEAGAGSGKTTMLVNRMVAMVEAGIDIRKISAITFTKAAANEFRERFQKLLIERSTSLTGHPWKDKNMAGQLPKPTNETRRRCEIALRDIDLCFMGTIDSFCKMVLSEHPYEAGIPSDANIISDTEAKELYRQQYVKLCNGFYGEELSCFAKAFRFLHGRDAEDAFLCAGELFMKHRNVHFNFDRINAADIDIDIDRRFATEKKELIRAIKCLVEHPELQARNKNYKRIAWEKIENSYRNIKGRWSNSFSSVLRGIRDLEKIQVVPEAMANYEAYLGFLFACGKIKNNNPIISDKDRYKLLLRKLENFQYNISMTFLEKCVPILEKSMRDKGYMTFFDCLYFLRNMLKKDAEEEGKLIRYINERHSYFLIDEFQDTDPMQAEVFFYLTAEKPVSQWRSCIPRKGSLFIVGDPKQSIYRFRGADVTSFLNVKKLFEASGGLILTLSRNFRSTKMLCEHFNHVFKEMLPEETENQSKFEGISAPERDSDGFQGVFSYMSYSSGKEKAEHPNETDPMRIADIIETLVGNEKYRIGVGKEDRKIRFSDIMVITSGKAKLGPIMEELHNRKIPLKVEGEVPFAKNKALCEVHKIYAAIANPDDQISLYGALTGEILGFSSDDILMFRLSGGIISFNDSMDKESMCLTNDMVQRVADTIAKFRKLRNKALRLSPAALFTKIINDFRIYEIVETNEMEILYYTMELLRNAEKSGQAISIEDGSKYIQSLIYDESEERCLSLDDGKDCVHMANLHKVKGLEAPIVILASAVVRRNKQIKASKRIIYGNIKTEGYVFSLERKGGYYGKYFETDNFSKEMDDEIKALESENERLVYVAGTRARNALIVWNKRNSKWGDLISDTVSDFFAQVDVESKREVEVAENVNATELYERAEKESALNNRCVEIATYTENNPSRLKLVYKWEEESVDVIAENPDGLEDSLEDQEETGAEVHCSPALLGTMVHKLMEILVSTKNRVDVKSAIQEILSEYETPEMESFETEISAVLDRVAKKMRDGGYKQTNGLSQDILGTLLRSDEVYCEVPFCYKEAVTEGPIIWNGVMDVVYLLDGHWHIVDYKTSADGKNLDVKYQAQLEVYRKAFKETTGFDADAFTYHIATE